ncbi:MAG: DnaJ domain-containing protein [Oceanicaulis sp.]
MSLVFALLGVLALLGALAYALARADSRKAAQTVRILIGVGGLLVGALLTLRGLAIAGVPIITAALGFLGVAARGGTRRPGSGGAGAGSAGSGAGPRRPGGMTRKEAAEILGVPEDADETAVRAAYRRLMKQVHPDAGGNDALAAKVHEARDVLLGRGPR